MENAKDNITTGDDAEKASDHDTPPNTPLPPKEKPKTTDMLCHPQVAFDFTILNDSADEAKVASFTSI